VQELLGVIIAELSDEDVEILRELAAERETPGDLTTDIGVQAVDALWEQTLAEAVRTPAMMQIRIRLSALEVKAISHCSDTSRVL